jgi:predicted RNA-binding Zn-ribbon protein involved in translation (DUF1610 family)
VAADEKLGQILYQVIEVGLRVVDETDDFPFDPVEREPRLLRLGETRRDGVVYQRFLPLEVLLFQSGILAYAQSDGKAVTPVRTWAPCLLSKEPRLAGEGLHNTRAFLMPAHKLQTIRRAGTRPIFTGPIPAGTGEHDYLCGRCGAPVLRSVTEREASPAVFQCVECGALNVVNGTRQNP